MDVFNPHIIQKDNLWLIYQFGFLDILSETRSKLLFSLLVQVLKVIQEKKVMHFYNSIIIYYYEYKISHNLF